MLEASLSPTDSKSTSTQVVRQTGRWLKPRQAGLESFTFSYLSASLVPLCICLYPQDITLDRGIYLWLIWVICEELNPLGEPTGLVFLWAELHPNARPIVRWERGRQAQRN